MNYISTEPVNSKLFSGVSYTLRRMSVSRRTAFNLAMASYLGKQRDIWHEREPLQAELVSIVNEFRLAANAETLPASATIAEHLKERDANPKIRERFTDEKVQQLMDLLAKEQRLDQDEMQPALVRWGLAKIEGLEIDGTPATVDLLIDAGPPELFTEIAEEISRVMQLSSVEARNLPSPTTSGAPVAEATNDSSASLASSAATT
jgi:hypothetical protein